MLGTAAHAAGTAEKPAASASGAKKPRSAQQEKMSSCSKQAKGKKGDERRAFMSSCLSNAPAASAQK
ncbi:hypothetical protein IM725_07575 [Ramlibacter aquaticus]|uniref:Phosphate starvation-inducible protein PsiF n=2 Tax=Comamonadaceae TaxID=80864 RepID=A0ABR9SDQ3_9BURK|nr:hypothetical protein [Ramlibacter aquaticus]